MAIGENRVLHRLVVARRHVSSALLEIPYFRLCDLQNHHIITMSVDECVRLATCIHGWWSCRHFLLLADGFSCRLFCDDIMVDLRLLETVLSPCSGHSLVFICHSLLLSVASSSVFAEGLLSGRWVV